MVASTQIFLIFCSGVYSTYTTSGVCTTPVVMPNMAACSFVGERMVQTANMVTQLYRSDGQKGIYRCLTVKS